MTNAFTFTSVLCLGDLLELTITCGQSAVPDPERGVSGGSQMRGGSHKLRIVYSVPQINHSNRFHSKANSYVTSPVSESASRSVVSNSLRPHGLYSPWNSPGQNTGVGSLSLFQGIFPTQGSNPGLLHCRRILYQLSHKDLSSENVTIFLQSTSLCPIDSSFH